MKRTRTSYDQGWADGYRRWKAIDTTVLVTRDADAYETGYRDGADTRQQDEDF